MKSYRKRRFKKTERTVESQTAEVRIPLLLRFSQLCDGRCWCGLLCVAAARWAVARARNKPWPPLLTLGSCDRQIWRIIKMKPPTDETAKSETEALLYYCSNTLVPVWKGKGKLCLGCCGKVTPSLKIPLKCDITRGRFSPTAQPPLDMF